ncbi:HDOD domain-containing protein [Gemmata sp. JC717]|uniref:HDOD domain-containing protein n=1 Tax=Gemmata algarum TaxID=2975278 RepID=UPI0021BAFB11|nr:HDOD domain-containing protein [Gemmata algarum]MDY3552330.1 HDOD domain-containing protein [Gemmata algarum]
MPTQTSRARRELLLTVFPPDLLPPAPAVVLQVYAAAGSPDCDPAHLAALLATDPALCVGVLRIANSCVYALPRPVASVSRAVHVLGRRTVRALTLALSAPGPRGPGARAYWLASVGGAIIARELAVLKRAPAPDEDMAAALLRDLGSELLRGAFPVRWAKHPQRHGHRLLFDPCGAENESFGANHADVGAALLARWGLPPEVVEPVRYHHRPDQAPAGPLKERAELLWLSDRLIRLDEVAAYPELLSQLLETAERRYALTPSAMTAFLDAVVPKIEAFAAAINVGDVHCPNLAATLKLI